MADLGAPVAESPEVVKGGPLDPTSPEGTPPEGHIVGDPSTPAPPHAPTPNAPEAPLYTGLTGDIKSTDDLKSYTKQLEDMLVQEKARQTSQTLFAPKTVAPTVPQGPTAKERFTDLIYSKPDEAFELTVQEAMGRIEQKNNQTLEAERQRKAFWNEFYDKNADLKKLDHIVQSVVTSRGPDISKIPDAKSVSDFISKETRKIVDIVKRETGFTETRLPSQNAVALGGSGEPVPTVPRTPQAPINFTEQIRRLKPSGKK